MDQHDDDKRPLGWGELLQSILAAALGVQSGRNRTRDFSRGRPVQFIVLGLLFSLIFVLVILGLVRLVLYLA
ncbi:MAG TPA: DUF2970 domain-containing protein [Pseudomonas sp.]|nr:DUF2970 domain-containing protein [Pseudomonas sp.]